MAKKQLRVKFFIFFRVSLRLHTMSLYSKMPSKRPLTSHGTCGIVNRPSNHNSVLSKGCQCIYVSQSILAGFGVKVKLIDSEFPLFKEGLSTDLCFSGVDL
ncbi:hypothetical protein SELMODRAFT_413634 [Selaginella moellendorffii]|uniref:Uncharacterized protein n=1 Tax=Selaginella moellendorffii TaxID=88036 RepID=D8RPQ7_SELML|nr:hypothetical protein SELMODRAFT_413634 [Selaginella moellendorffii]